MQVIFYISLNLRQLIFFHVTNYYISSKKLFLSYWTDVKIADFYVSLCLQSLARSISSKSKVCCHRL